MTDRVLSGASREAWSFLTSHWKSLTKVSVIPFLIYFATSLLVHLAHIKNLRHPNTSPSGGNVDQWTLIVTIGEFSSYVILICMCLTVCKFYNHDKPFHSGIYSLFSKDVFLAFIYVIVCVFISSFAMFPVYIADNIFAVESDQVLSFSVRSFVSILLHFLVFIVSLALTLYLFCRLIVGLFRLSSTWPWSGNILKMSWEISKCESVGLPFRFGAWAVVIGLMYSCLIAISHLFVFVSQMEGKTWISLLFDQPNFGFEMAEKILPLQMAALLMHLPIVWFFSLLLSVSSARLYGQWKSSENIVLG